MHFKPLKSSMLTAAAYDPASRRLVVRFKGDNEYEYTDVPPEHFEALCCAESVGKFFGANIRGAYPSKKLEKEKTSTHPQDGKE